MSVFACVFWKRLQYESAEFISFLGGKGTSNKICVCLFYTGSEGRGGWAMPMPDGMPSALVRDPFHPHPPSPTHIPPPPLPSSHPSQPGRISSMKRIITVVPTVPRQGQGTYAIMQDARQKHEGQLVPFMSSPPQRNISTGVMSWEISGCRM